MIQLKQEKRICNSCEKLISVVKFAKKYNIYFKFAHFTNPGVNWPIPFQNKNASRFKNSLTLRYSKQIIVNFYSLQSQISTFVFSIHRFHDGRNSRSDKFFTHRWYYFTLCRRKRFGISFNTWVSHEKLILAIFHFFKFKLRTLFLNWETNSAQRTPGKIIFNKFFASKNIFALIFLKIAKKQCLF